ncbi:hypothetical protein IMCC3317_27630 [Kordia antarctica]|uniref:Pregnancy-associated plasma protein-A n=1 Tax=Kordia antarctica TaxID=1218801 RepID=A0A7L4ZNA7_9FLAO|nr:M43 family zinc metalloprotease [Kordia antarctica]QHI37384.1 hypothetical protein IMCC3317_27630 [Kordia antarctica]
MKNITLLVLTLFCIGTIFAQERDCSTMENLEYRKQLDPQLEARMQQIEDFTRQRIQEAGSQESITGNIISIPVVVHVIYNNANENISQAQIQSQLDVLNEDFRRTNTDTSNRWSQAADTEIQFCLATVDPNGNPTIGITRKSSPTTAWGTNDAMKKSSEGGVDPWNTNQYLNMWVCNLGSGLLGYAQFPGGSAATDGVAMSPQYFGSSAKGTGFYLSAPFDLGRTTTHEVGHFLNLRHIWGDGGCGVDDFVSDTPASDGPNYGCDSTHVSCASTDMVQNYMDYSADACMNLYTAGQKARMRAILGTGGSRRSLALSDKCNSTTPPPPTPTCTDGVQNGDETGVDCGGSACAPCQIPGDTLLHEGYFESGLDGWSDGGSDCHRYKGKRSYEGKYSMRIRDNSGTSSAMTSEEFDLTGYDQVEFKFFFYPNSMENGEDFWIRYYNGSSWNTVATYTSGNDFTNRSYYAGIITLNSADVNFASNSQFRIQCDAGNNSDQVYIDQVTITGINGGTARATVDGLQLSRTGPQEPVSGDHLITPTITRGDITVNLISYNINSSYRILNLLGQTVKTGILKDGGRLNVSELKSGVYLLELSDEEERIIQKFVKQ